MRIILDTTPNAPGCYAVINAEDESKTVLFQTDWDFPSLASTFGWRGLAKHDGTDGTIACPHCGKEPGFFIGKAIDYLDRHDGKTAEDPGYFAGDGD